MTAPENLVLQDTQGGYPSRFRVHGREYVVVPGGPVTFDRRGMIIRVWPQQGARRELRDLRIPSTARVTILTRLEPGTLREYREGTGR